MNLERRRRPLAVIIYLVMVALGGVLSIPVFHEIDISIRAHADERQRQLQALEP